MPRLCSLHSWRLAWRDAGNHFAEMPRKTRRSPPPLPLLWTELMMASAETIARRTMLMAEGRCSPAEQRRMVREKADAAAATGALLLASQLDAAALLMPWHRAARANAQRLRRGTRAKLRR